MADGRGGVVLRGKDIATAPSDLRPQLDQRFDEHRAVWMVMCKQPAIRAPFSGFDEPYFCRSAISPGISFSASMISLRPHSAREMSATLYGSRVVTCATNISFKLSCGMMVDRIGKMRPKTRYHRSSGRRLAR